MRMRWTIAIGLLGVVLAVVSALGNAQNFSVLYNFGSVGGDPVNPQPELIAQGLDGNLYSTTEMGGTNGNGTVFAISPDGVLRVIYGSFDLGTSGVFPTGGLTLGTDGNFYGVNQAGGSIGFGTIFKITTDGTLTILHNFGGNDGATPFAPPIQGTDGNFYGTTWYGGRGHGVVYRLTSAGTFAVLHKFNETDGAGPLAALIQASDGSFYGTTFGGGTYGDGTVFTMTRGGKFSTVYMFDGPTGNAPSTQLVEGKDGFYGTTTSGGTYGLGEAFKVTRAGQITVIYSFAGGSSEDGRDPEGGLLLTPQGGVYGTTFQGGKDKDGTIYRISATGVYHTIHQFNGKSGSGPLATLVQHTTGLIYGDTWVGGTPGRGVFYGLNAGLKPFVKLLTYSGKHGQSIGILGQGFTGATAVLFNGTPASFNVISDTYMTATVPKMATTGIVKVTTPSGVLKSHKNFVIM
jgi:uncharacterized repeat protein (TIGR03803 family)